VVISEYGVCFAFYACYLFILEEIEVMKGSSKQNWNGAVPHDLSGYHGQNSEVILSSYKVPS
jgi:hypothetical protein